MFTPGDSTVLFTADEMEVLNALLAGTFRPEDADTAVRVIEDVATLMGRLQGMQVHAVACLDQIRGGSRGALAELMLALCATKNHAELVMAVARALMTRLPRTLALLESGKVDWYRASKVVEATAWLSDEDAAAVDEALSSRLVGKNPTQVRKAANHAAAKADPEGADRRTATRRAGRRLTLTHQESGTAELSVDDAPVEKAVAAYRRIDRFARALKTRDEVRTLDQLRADVAMDLLLGGTSGKVGVQAEVFLYMDMNTYLGLNNDPVEMAGHGHIPAELATYIATGPDTVLRRIITDPLTGQVAELGRTRYRPTVEVDEFVRVRDRECRGIGCSRPAQSCDIDHHVDWAFGGLTNVNDLIIYCRFEHS